MQGFEFYDKFSKLQVDLILNMWCCMFAHNWTMEIGMKRGHYFAILYTFPFALPFWAFKVVFFQSNPCQGLAPTLGVMEVKLKKKSEQKKVKSKVKWNAKKKKNLKKISEMKKKGESEESSKVMKSNPWPSC